MKKNRIIKTLINLPFFCLLFLIVSCGSTKKVPYFQDISGLARSSIDTTAVFTEPIIRADDILSINVFTIDPQSSAVINQSANIEALGSSSAAANIGQKVSGFLVDKNGEVELAIVGKVKLAGLTTSQARELIREKVTALYNKPTVEVRFANFKVTVLGEVTRPATYTLPNERVTLLDALGLAGDLTIFGRRENVLLIRDVNGKKEFARFDLNSTDIFSNPYFYLRQNDVIYVEPNKGKAASLNTARTQTFAIIGTALSVLLVLVTRL